MGQLGFGDGWISAKVGQNAALERLSREVEWRRFEKILSRLRPDGAGRPPFEPLLMLKALLLQQWYRLSDADLEEAINDRVSFRKFLGLSLEAASPDHTTLCRFRNRLAEAGLSERLFGEFATQLDERRLLLKQGTMIDASLVATPHRPGSADGSREAVDADARLTARKGRPGTSYGYKLHAGVDQRSRLIRKVVLTPANVNDTVPADGLVCGDERAVYADKAYAKRVRTQWLKSRGIKPRIMHKSWGGGPPLSAWQKRHNALIAPIRA
ncbi:MAG: IS5 family transposase, partial [Pseudonocardiaceae bacterium]